ncbi:unnamed protein product, partial [Brassica rapa]
WSPPRKRRAERSKPPLRLETSLHTMTARRRQVDTSTATYHPKDEPHKRDFDKHKPLKDRENEKKQEPPSSEATTSGKHSIDKAIPGIHSPAI